MAFPPPTTTGSQSGSTTTEGNSVTGVYASDGNSHYETAVAETDTNGPLSVVLSTTTIGDGLSTGSGNSITGDHAKQDTHFADAVKSKLG